MIDNDKSDSSGNKDSVKLSSESELMNSKPLTDEQRTELKRQFSEHNTESQKYIKSLTENN